MPTKNRFPTAHVLNVHERFFLIDCGEGTQIQLKRYGNVKYSRLDNIFISHMHGDHVFGIFGLLSSFALIGRTADLHIYACKELAGVLSAHVKYFGENMKYKVVHHSVDTESNAVIYEDQYMTVETIPLKHRIPTCGFLFREKTPQLNIRKEVIKKYRLSVNEITLIKNGGDYKTPSGETIPNSRLAYLPYSPRAYAYCSDTMFCRKVAETVVGVDLLYHEATFLSDMKASARQTGHSTAKEAAEIALLAKVKRLLLGHFSSRYDDNMLPLFAKEAREIFPDSDIVREGMTYEMKRNEKDCRNKS